MRLCFPFPSFIPSAARFRIRLFHHYIPLMVMSYVGSLKTWIYWPLVHCSVAAFGRALAVASGAITVFIFYHLIRGIETGGERRRGFAGAFLLATDPVFLMTNTFDWGPVALEHLLLVGGCFLLFRFTTNQSQTRPLALGFFCFGLALWNKALFAWALSD